jgi:hypothetical protein
VNQFAFSVQRGVLRRRFPYHASEAGANQEIGGGANGWKAVRWDLSRNTNPDFENKARVDLRIFVYGCSRKEAQMSQENIFPNIGAREEDASRSAGLANK